MSIDIFHEQLTLRSAEGDVRVVGLADFNREMAELRGEAAAAANGDDSVAVQEPDDIEMENGEDISPELLFTAEHESLSTIELIVEEEPQTAAPPGQPEASPDAVPGAGDEKGSRRRRGRRGGRRGRGSDSGER